MSTQSNLTNAGLGKIQAAVFSSICDRDRGTTRSYLWDSPSNTARLLAGLAKRGLLQRVGNDLGQGTVYEVSEKGRSLYADASAETRRRIAARRAERRHEDEVRAAERDVADENLRELRVMLGLPSDARPLSRTEVRAAIENLRGLRARFGK